jgi:CheY-like chemotaxis protein
MSTQRSKKQKRILWIEDDHFHLKYLMYKLEGDGYKIDIADSAYEGYQKAKQWDQYVAIVVDLILPMTSELVDEPIPSEVLRWEENEYLGAGLVKWLLQEQKVDIPVILLTVVNDPLQRYNLQDIGIDGYLKKSALRPSKVKQYIMDLLKNSSPQPH